MPEPPLKSANVLTDFDVWYRMDVTLARGLAAVLPQIAEYLDMDDSRDILKEPTHDTQNVDKELSDDNQNIDKNLVDDSRDVQKDRAPKAIERGHAIKVTSIGSGSTLRTSESTLPALEALVQATRVRVLMEEADSDSDDGEVSVVKMEVDPPLKMKGKGTSNHPVDLTSDSDSDKENDRNHPGPMCHHRLDLLKVQGTVIVRQQ